MKTILKVLLSLGLALTVILGLTISVSAETPDCKLTVELNDSEKKAVNGVQVHICRIADIQGSDYYPAEDFENSGISIAGIINAPNENTAKTVLDYVNKNGIPTLSTPTQSGKAEFLGIERGIWLVFAEDNGGYSFNPHIVFLPYTANGKLIYDLTSTPKVEVKPDTKSINVIKKWDDRNNTAKKRPDRITVELKCDGNLIDTAVLYDGNGWSYTFTGLSPDGKYSVSEKAVANYIAKYSGDEQNGFIITNTYSGEKLPQTGQLWWPILIISIAGVGFILLGIIELGVKKHGKDKK